MGGNQSQGVIYSVPVTEKKDGETAIRRNPMSEKELFLYPDVECRNLKDVYLRAVKSYGKKNFLGTLNNGEYVYKTFSDVENLARWVGSGIENRNLAPEIQEYKQYKLKMTGIFAKNREEWMILDISNALYGRTMVPLYDTLGLETISYVIEHANLHNCVCSKEGMDQIFKAGKIHNLKYLIALDPVSEEQRKKAGEMKLEIISWTQLIEEGKTKEVPYQDEIDLDHCFTFSYTSGTTGWPKGAMISHRNLLAVITGLHLSDGRPLSTDVYISYLPLPHVMERLIVWNGVYAGMEICFYGGDTNKLKDDIQKVRPTIFLSVPRIYNRFYGVMKQKLDEAEGCKKGIVQKALADKLHNVQTTGDVTHKVWDNMVFNKTAAGLGGRCRFMASGSAPMGKDVLDFMKVAICCPFYQGYGQTEGTGASFVTAQKDPQSGSVGGPVCAIEYKLIDVPEMNYLSTDPNPRGEICIRGHSVFLGYYKDEEKTKEAVDADGFLHSGDVGEILPNGALKIIDRAKNIFKLAQGEYVAPEKVEQIYVKSPGIESVFLHGDSLQYYCVAVVSPTKQKVLDLAKEEGLNGTFEELCQAKSIRKYYLKQLIKHGKDAGITGFEQAKNIHLSPQTLQELGLTTVTMKTQRHQAKIHFKDLFEALYKEGEMDLK